MDLKKTAIIVVIVLLALISPLIIAATGFSSLVENYALSRPDSGFAEWSARMLVGTYVLVLKQDKRMDLGRRYLETFDEESAAYDEEKYKKVFWAYADACTTVLRTGKKGIGYYEYWEEFPDDDKAEEAKELAEKYGYRDAL